MITTASELWAHWTSKNFLRPQDYDTDIADCVRRGLGGPSIPCAGLPSAMDAAGWDARDLIRAILPVLASFSGMLVDLLALYERVGATTTDKDNLRISYEFAPGVEWDDRLAPFRETVQRAQTVIAEIAAFRFRSGHAWQSPLRHAAHGAVAENVLSAGAKALGIDTSVDRHALPFTPEVPAFVADDREWRAVIMRHRQVISAAVERLATLGSSFLDVIGPRGGETSPSLDQADLDLAYAASDRWAISEIGCLSKLPEIVKSLAQNEAELLLQEQSTWLEGFWTTEAVPLEQQIDHLTDILALPQWGQRFDLYSAWIVAAMDTALAPERLIFDVTDGVLAFPFRANMLARVVTSRGPVELWSEKRFTASGMVGKSRKNHIQPDFVFIDSASSKVSVVVEAKQYKKGHSKNPGHAAHDYAANLKDARVLVVAHGPLRARSIELVASQDRSRVAFHHDVRPGSPRAIARLREELVQLLPPPEPAGSDDTGQEVLGVPDVLAGPPHSTNAVESHVSNVGTAGVVLLRWLDEVHDLDLHIIDATTGETVYYEHLAASHASLGVDAYDGGPEWAFLHEITHDVVVEVHLFSKDVETVQQAEPTVTITTRRESVTLAPPLNSAPARDWRVATVRADGSILPHA